MTDSHVCCKCGKRMSKIEDLKEHKCHWLKELMYSEVTFITMVVSWIIMDAVGDNFWGCVVAVVLVLLFDWWMRKSFFAGKIK